MADQFPDGNIFDDSFNQEDLSSGDSITFFEEDTSRFLLPDESFNEDSDVSLHEDSAQSEGTIDLVSPDEDSVEEIQDITPAGPENQPSAIGMRYIYTGDEDEPRPQRSEINTDMNPEREAEINFDLDRDSDVIVISDSDEENRAVERSVSESSSETIKPDYGFLSSSNEEVDLDSGEYNRKRRKDYSKTQKSRKKRRTTAASEDQEANLPSNMLDKARPSASNRH